MKSIFVPVTAMQQQNQKCEQKDQFQKLEDIDELSASFVVEGSPKIHENVEKSRMKKAINNTKKANKNKTTVSTQAMKMFRKSQISIFGFLNETLQRRQKWDEFVLDYHDDSRKSFLIHQQEKAQNRSRIIQSMEAQSIGMSLEALTYHLDHMNDSDYMLNTKRKTAAGNNYSGHCYYFLECDDENTDDNYNFKMSKHEGRRNSVSFPKRILNDTKLYTNFLSSPHLSLSASELHFPSLLGERNATI